MVSFKDLLDTAGSEPAGDHSATVEAPADVLAAVKRDGARRRARRHRRNAVVGGLAVLLVAAPAIALWPAGSDGSHVTVAADATGPQPRDDDVAQTASSTTSSVPSDTTVLGAAPPETTAVTSVSGPVGPPTTVPAPVCRDSTDPTCGDFYWDPAPAPNQPLILTTPEAVTLQPGEPYVIEVHWSDADAPLSFDWFSTDGAELIEPCTTARRYGPWTPPEAVPGSGVLTYDYTAPSQPGTYTLSAYGFSGRAIGGSFSCGADPYESSARTVITVNVVGPPQQAP